MEMSYCPGIDCIIIQTMIWRIRSKTNKDIPGKNRRRTFAILWAGSGNKGLGWNHIGKRCNFTYDKVKTGMSCVHWDGGARNFTQRLLGQRKRLCGMDMSQYMEAREQFVCLNTMWGCNVSPPRKKRKSITWKKNLKKYVSSEFYTHIRHSLEKSCMFFVNRNYFNSLATQNLVPQNVPHKNMPPFWQPHSEFMKIREFADFSG